MSVLDPIPVLGIESIEIDGPTIEDMPTSRVLPEFAKTKQQQADLGVKLQQWIAQGLAAKGSINQIWARIARFNRDDPSGDSAPDDQASPIHRPFISTRCDTLTAQMVNIMATPRPTALCEAYDGDDELASRIERVMQRQIDQGGFDDSLGEVVQNAILYNCGIFRVSFELQFGDILTEGSDQVEANLDGPLKYAGLKFASIDPNDFVISPSTVDGVKSAQICGERFYRRREWIKEQIELGNFLEGYALPAGGDNPADHDDLLGYIASMTAPSASTGTEETELVELWELYVKMPPAPGKREKLYRAIVSFRECCLFEVENWHYSTPPYFRGKTLVDTIKWWGTRSIGRSAVPMNQQYNNYHALLYNGNDRAAQYFFTSMEPLGEKVVQFQSGSSLQTDGPVQQHTITFSPDAVMKAIGDLERAGDLTFGVTSQNQGVPDPKEQTATGVQAQTQGAQTRLGAFLWNFQMEMPAMFSFACELLADHWILWSAFDPDATQEADFGSPDDPSTARPLTREDFKRAKRWTVNGRTPSSTPMAKLAELQQLNAMSQNPATGLDTYQITKAYLSTAAIPGSRNFQKQQPNGQPTPSPTIPGEPAVAGPQEPPVLAQRTDQGEMLPPNENVTVRPSGIGTPSGPG